MFKSNCKNKLAILVFIYIVYCPIFTIRHSASISVDCRLIFIYCRVQFAVRHMAEKCVVSLISSPYTWDHMRENLFNQTPLSLAVEIGYLPVSFHLCGLVPTSPPLDAAKVPLALSDLLLNPGLVFQQPLTLPQVSCQSRTSLSPMRQDWR